MLLSTASVNHILGHEHVLSSTRTCLAVNLTASYYFDYVLKKKKKEKKRKEKKKITDVLYINRKMSPSYWLRHVWYQ